MSETESEFDEWDEANAVMIYDVGEIYVGIHYPGEDTDHVFQSTGETVEDAVDDMLQTLNHLPTGVEKIANDEAELVDVRPLRRKEADQQ